MVQHLALDVERFWFAGVVAGEPIDLSEDNGWRVPWDQAAETVLALYRGRDERASLIVEATAPDAPPAFWRGGLSGSFVHTLREIVLHVITGDGVSCRASRPRHTELIDQRTWLILTD